MMAAMKIQGAGVWATMFLSAFALGTTSLSAESGYSPAATCRTDQIANPIIRGMAPDPSIIFSGGQYYLVTSSFEYFPGLPIYQSSDLINWTLVANALTRPEQLDLIDMPSNRGVYAPTLREHEGTFYITAAIAGPDRPNRRKGNFVITAKSPEGPWSDPIWIDGAPGIDPSLFFDEDGRAYLSANERPPEEQLVNPRHRWIWTQEIDVATWRLVGERVYLDAGPYIQDDSIGPAVHFEGPHIYRHAGRYYMLVSHGGTAEDHAVSIWRGDSPMGPWTGNPANPIATNRNHPDLPISAIGHADLVQTASGAWWTVMLGVRATDGRSSAMGRETVLAKVDWKGGWPVINADAAPGLVEACVTSPDPRAIAPTAGSFADHFTAGARRPDWVALRASDRNWASVSKRKGWLTLTARPDAFAQFELPSFSAIRVPEQRATIETRMDFAPVSPGETAGLAIVRGPAAAHWFGRFLRDGQHHIGAWTNEGMIGSIPFAATQPIQLRLHLDGPMLGFFVRSEETGNWIPVASAEAPAVVFNDDGWFTGAVAGPYASTHGGASSGSDAHFDWFVIRPLP